MYRGKKVSLVFPAYNEEANIAQAVREVKQTHIVDEIIVVNNNSSDKTARLARTAGAKVVTEKKQGYGFALRKGLSVATGDYIFLSEPDGTFDARDTRRLLAELIRRRVDSVFGSRTNLKYIQPGAHMGLLLRLGNLGLAKWIQLLYQTPSLSDCGCTFRVLKRPVINALLPELTVGGSHLLAEVVIKSAAMCFTFYELPVHYRPRIGTSKITGSLTRAVMVGWRMFRLINVYRLRSLINPRFQRMYE